MECECYSLACLLINSAVERHSVVIRDFTESDFLSIQSIYQEGIETGNATFQIQTKSWDEWNNSFLSSCRLVAKQADEIVGWAALSPVSSRFVYRGVAEVSVYVGARFSGAGIGDALLSALIEVSEKAGIWTLQSGIFPENKASIRIHEKNGFRVLGIREKIGELKGVWRDVVLMERRSKVAGI